MVAGGGSLVMSGTAGSLVGVVGEKALTGVAKKPVLPLQRVRLSSFSPVPDRRKSISKLENSVTNQEIEITESDLTDMKPSCSNSS